MCSFFYPSKRTRVFSLEIARVARTIDRAHEAIGGGGGASLRRRGARDQLGGIVQLARGARIVVRRVQPCRWMSGYAGG